MVTSRRHWMMDSRYKRYNFFTALLNVELQDEAAVFADFLVPMLDLNHEKRISAAEALKHAWLDGV